MAVFVSVDAKRLNVDPTRRTQYEMGILLAMVGFVFFAHYLLKRQELAHRDGEQPSQER